MHVPNGISDIHGQVREKSAQRYFEREKCR
jgi:hypothetical protein